MTNRDKSGRFARNYSNYRKTEKQWTYFDSFLVGLISGLLVAIIVFTVVFR